MLNSKMTHSQTSCFDQYAHTRKVSATGFKQCTKQEKFTEGKVAPVPKHHAMKAEMGH
jgi:hypothetical protein